MRLSFTNFRHAMCVDVVAKHLSLVRMEHDLSYTNQFVVSYREIFACPIFTVWALKKSNEHIDYKQY